MRNFLFNARALAEPTKTTEMSQPGSTLFATAENAERGLPKVDRVKFFIETPAILLALAALAGTLGGRVYLAELYELVVGLAADFRYEGALVADVL